MTLEAASVAKLQQVPERTREKVLALLHEWMKLHRATEPEEIPQAVAVVHNTWSTLTFDYDTLRWVAEDKELEYDLG
jgi:hypothetical protein